jgi:hypothetical protein
MWRCTWKTLLYCCEKLTVRDKQNALNRVQWKFDRNTVIRNSRGEPGP